MRALGVKNPSTVAMSKKIYKYMGPEVPKLAFSSEGLCSLKCSYPNEFNDPYELFLTINFQNSPPELLAYYQEIVGKIPKNPVTCFSKAPDVIPMWAHYGHNHRGVVLEFDEEEFSRLLPDAGFGDVDYRDQADEDLEETLVRAFHIGKPRYHFFLHQGVFSAAYYTKHSAWSYEQERRMVLGVELIQERGGLKLIEFPDSCITSLISGSSASEETRQFVAELAESIGASYYEMKIGQSSPKPYFIGPGETVSVFEEADIALATNICTECKEPIGEEETTCPWCGIEEEHQLDAAQQNPLRMMERAGVLGDWYQSMLDVRKEK
jgi:hypothetical protein